MLGTGWVALDSVRLRRALLGVTAGDNVMAASGPTQEPAPVCRGVGARVGLGDVSLHVLAGRAPDELDYRTFKQNRYFVGLEGAYSRPGVSVSPYLVHRADNDTVDNSTVGAETQLDIGTRVRVNARTAVSSFQQLSVRTTAGAGRFDCTYSYGRLMTWGELSSVGRGYLSPGAALHQDDRCDLNLGTRYSAGALTLTGAGSRYWSERARANGSQVGTAVSLDLPKLPVATLDAGLRTGRDTIRETKTLLARVGIQKCTNGWRFAAWAEHDESLATKTRANSFQTDFELSSWRYLTGRVEAGIGDGQPLTNFVRVSATSDPCDWLQLHGGAGVTRTRLDHDNSTGRSGQCGITLKPTPFLSLSGCFDVASAKRPTGLDSVTGFTNGELEIKPINWLSLSGHLGAGSYEQAESRGRLFRAGASVGVILNKFVRAEIGAERQIRGNVRDNKVVLGLHQSGDPTNLGLVWVSGHVFLDRDLNRVYSRGDAPLPGVRVMLNDTLAATTNKAGEYWFPAPQGRFIVRYDPNTLPASIGSLQGRRQVKVGFLGATRVDFPLYELGEISGCVYEDTNRNGVREPDEPALPNVVVRLENPYDKVTVTDAQGRFLLANLDPRTYKVSIRDLPPDFIMTTPASLTVELAPGQRAVVELGLAPKPRPTIRKVFPPQ